MGTPFSPLTAAGGLKGVDHAVAIDGQQQREGRTIVSKPPVVRPVPGRGIRSDTVPGRPTAARALQAGTRQKRGSTDLYALALPGRSGECGWQRLEQVAAIALVDRSHGYMMI